MPCEESKAIMQMPGGGRALRIEKRARHVAHKYLRMLLIIAQWRTCCSMRRREGNRELELGRLAEAGSWNWGTGNFDQAKLRFLFNLKSGKIYITLVACTSIPPYPSLSLHIPSCFRAYLWTGAGHLSPVDATMLPAACAGQIESRF